MADGRPIHPETISILHPKFRRIFIPVSLGALIVYVSANIGMGYLLTLNMLERGLNRKEIIQEYRQFDEEFFPVSKVTSLGREAALYFHSNKSEQENPKPSNSYPKNAA